VGIDVTRYLVLAAVKSAALAGGAGSLYAHYLKIIDPDIFLFIYTVTMAIMVITGARAPGGADRRRNHFRFPAGDRTPDRGPGGNGSYAPG
jgi:ribose/xylose/arabinose/galactoside ABC-type transport system permease subunit